jgi:hypothetical protein
MSNWYTKLNNDFRSKLKGYGKSNLEVDKGCTLLIETLDILLKKIPKTARLIAENGNGTNETINENYAWLTLYDEITEYKEHFLFCSDLVTGKIGEDEWSDFGFDGDGLKLFNEYLSGFYDICDTYVKKDTKFCWIEF